VSADDPAVVRPAGPKPRYHWKTWTAVAGICAIVLVAGLVASTFVGPWAPAAHWTCVDKTRIAAGVAFYPVVLVNSPFGGRGWANGSISQNFPGFGGVSESSFSWNGTSTGTFNDVNITIYRTASMLAPGPGFNTPCAGVLAAVPSQAPFLVTYAGFTVEVPSNLTDQGESTSLPFTSYANYTNLPVMFNNSFTQSNLPSITTCGGPAQYEPVGTTSHTLSIRVQYMADGTTQTTLMVLPFAESYDYLFPADFGTWQIDNLSAPGGPGGGWAFSYSPCS
jgi:hypothetical protein